MKIHPLCASRCQYAEDVGMPEHKCQGKCQMEGIASFEEDKPWFTGTEMRAYAAQCVRVALEEAAKVCDRIEYISEDSHRPDKADGANACAAAIRSMINEGKE